jgi:hypothetical protein
MQVIVRVLDAAVMPMRVGMGRGSHGVTLFEATELPQRDRRPPCDQE